MSESTAKQKARGFSLTGTAFCNAGMRRPRRRGSGLIKGHHTYFRSPFCLRPRLCRRDECPCLAPPFSGLAATILLAGWCRPDGFVLRNHPVIRISTRRAEPDGARKLAASRPGGNSGRLNTKASDASTDNISGGNDARLPAGASETNGPREERHAPHALHLRLLRQAPLLFHLRQGSGGGTHLDDDPVRDGRPLQLRVGGTPLDNGPHGHAKDRSEGQAKLRLIPRRDQAQSSRPS